MARIGYRVQGVLVRNPFLALVGLLTWLALGIQIGHSQIVASTLPITDDLDRESLRLAINRSMFYLSKLPADRIVGEQPRQMSAGQVLDSLAALDRLLDRWDCWRCFVGEFMSRFELIPSSRDEQQKQVLFTGYYQPVIEGNLVETREYRYPIYGKPTDLVTLGGLAAGSGETEKISGRVGGERFAPYYTRREIDHAQLLRGRGLEIAWVKDPVELFFLHIQGSGILQLPDGKRLHIGYAGQNGRPYRSIGRLLIDQGKISQTEMSMQRLRRHLAEHPEERDEIMAHNESYVFFRVTEAGPFGSLEVPVTAGRSIATDSRLFPKGAPALIYSESPVLNGAGDLIGWRPFVRFVLNQDTGGAIRGFQRADLYMGSGAGAGAHAGYMNSPGKIYFLMLKNLRARGRYFVR
ncbi:MAG TPA: MltA domain-containing protein [Candidatus Binatia bacterium]